MVSMEALQLPARAQGAAEYAAQLAGALQSEHVAARLALGFSRAASAVVLEHRTGFEAGVQ